MALGMVTAGALNSLGTALKLDAVTPQSSGFTANLGKNIINNVASATMNSALTGGDLEAGLKTALVGAVTSTGAAFGAQFIGDMTVPGGPGQPAQLNPAGQALAHALLGCVAGAAGQGDSEGCGAGASGAVIGELAARWYNPTGSASAQDTVAFASLMAGAGVALAGRGDADSVNTAAVTAANAAANNWLAHADILRKKQLESERSSCRDEVCRQDKDAQLKAIDTLDKTRDAILRQACNGNNAVACQAEQQKVRSAAAEIVRDARLSIIVSADGLHTISQAAGGLSAGGLLFETGKGTLVSIVQPYADAATFISQLVSDPNAAWGGVTAKADDVKRAAAWIAQNAEKYRQLVELSSQKLRSSLATALESGDEKQIGAAMGAMASVFIPEPGKKAALADDLVREVSILSRIEESAAKAVKVPTASGYLSKAKLGEAVIVPPKTWDQTLMMQDIIANGDRLGTKTESLVSSLLASDPNIKVLSGTKYSGNNGLDHVIQFVDSQTGKTMTMVLDSKQLAKTGSVALDANAAGTAYYKSAVMQLSNPSLEAVVDRLDGSPSAIAISKAMNNGTLIKAVTFLDKFTGELKIVRVDPRSPV